MTHKGSCHCGQVAFEVEGELKNVTECNCSICSRKGIKMWFVPRGSLRLTTPEGKMSDYQFNKHVIHHRFCATCGIHTFGEGQDPKGNPMAAINVRCLEGVDLDALPVNKFDGRKL
jgi:hypothetical protein